MENTKEKRTIFSDSIDPIDVLSKFLKENGFEESIDDADKKMGEGKDPWISVLSHGTLDFASKKISEKDLAEFLKKEFNTSKGIAEELVKKIKADLLPLTINVVIENDNATQEKQVTTVKPIKLINERSNNAKNELQTPPTKENAGGLPKITKRAPKLPNNLENKNIAHFQKKQDSYREPIE